MIVNEILQEQEKKTIKKNFIITIIAKSGANQNKNRNIKTKYTK